MRVRNDSTGILWRPAWPQTKQCIHGCADAGNGGEGQTRSQGDPQDMAQYGW